MKAHLFTVLTLLLVTGFVLLGIKYPSVLCYVTLLGVGVLVYKTIYMLISDHLEYRDRLKRSKK